MKRVCCWHFNKENMESESQLTIICVITQDVDKLVDNISIIESYIESLAT